jgi:histidinol phosphatase-like enzyme
MEKTIIVDIDGTISFEAPDGNHHNSTPRPEWVDEINRLYDAGYKIIYWSARGTVTKKDWTELTKKQFDEWGVKYHEFILYKPYYTYWIDDRALNPACSECKKRISQL